MMSSSTSADKVPPPPLPPRVPNLAQSLPVTSSDSDEDTVPRKGRRAPPPPVPRRSANQPVPESSPPVPSGGPKKTRWSDEDGDDEADPDNGVSEPPSCLAPVLTSGSKNSSPCESTSLPGEQFKDTVPVRTGTIKTPIVTLLNIDSDSQLDSVDSGVSVTGSDSEATGAPGDQLRAPNPSNCPQQLMGPDSQAAHQLASSESEPAAHLPTGPLGQVEPYGGPEVSETKAGASVSSSPSRPLLEPFECGQCEPLVHLVRVVQDEGPVFTSKVTLTTCPPSESVIVSRHVVDHKDGLAGDVSPDSTCSHMSTTAAETTPGPGSGAKGSTGPASGQPSGPEADGPPIRPAKAVPRKLKGLLKKSWSECGTETTDGRIPDDKGGKRRKNVTFSETMMVFCDDWPMELMPHIVAMKSPGDFNLVEMTQGYMFEPPAEYQDMLPFDPPLDYRDIIAAVSNPAQGGGATGDLVTNGNEFAFIDDEGNQANGTLMKGDSEDIYWESMILNDKEMIEEDAIIGVLKEDALLQAIGSHVDNVFHPPAHENLGQNDFPVHYLSSSTFSSSLEAGQVNSSASPSSSSYDHQHSDHHHHQQHHHHHSGQQEPTATIILSHRPDQ
ncbi:hypothetical protein HDE_13109 [Halotydeus destructor]|nr:hypothetical protein HDE_13109 [Halotydeus destructor]